MPENTVQQAHDALLALMPSNAIHDDCSLCGSGRDAKQEVAQVAETTPPAPAGNVYSEAQHFSLLKSAVEQETAALATEKSELQARIETLESEKADLATELSQAKSTIDVLESGKATAEAAAETAKTELADFKAEIERKREIEEKKSVRKDRVKAANENLGDGYFSDERITRWAEMSDEAFDALVAEMTEFAAATQPGEPTGPTGPSGPTGATGPTGEPKTTNEKARETAAFSGGETASTEGEGTVLAQFLARRQAAV